MGLDYEQEYWRDEKHKEEVEEARQLLATDAWYRLNGMLSPYSREQITKAEELIKGVVP